MPPPARGRVGESGIPVVVMGLGDIGRAIARAAASHPDLDLVAAVDPAHEGKMLDALAGPPCSPIPIGADPSAAFARVKGGVLFHATGSRFDVVISQIEPAVRAGLSVVSTCEELAYPRLRHEEAAEALDRLCEERGVAVVGTGVNPGFVLDRLPAFLAQAAGAVRHVRGVRVVDAARRRLALQRKIGAGLSEDEFDEAYERGEVGHVGLAESAALAAEGCGFDIDEAEIDEEIAPLLAEEDYDGTVRVRRGQVAGIRQAARVFVGDREVVRLELTVQIGADNPRDEVELDADPPIKVIVPGGIAGDEATANTVANAAAAVIERHGLLTVLDLPAGR